MAVHVVPAIVWAGRLPDRYSMMILGVYCIKLMSTLFMLIQPKLFTVVVKVRPRYRDTRVLIKMRSVKVCLHDAREDLPRESLEGNPGPQKKTTSWLKRIDSDLNFG